MGTKERLTEEQRIEDQREARVRTAENPAVGRDVPRSEPADTYVVDSAGTTSPVEINPEERPMGRSGSAMNWVWIGLGVLIVLALLLLLL